jgi:sulfatase maturation enzyme AslB (radical SAM superfamily)
MVDDRCEARLPDGADEARNRDRPTTRADNTRLNLEEQMTGQTVLASYPTLVLLELTDKCNLNCVMCYRYNTDLDGHIADEVYDRIKMMLFLLASRVAFSCKAGEPTLYPKWSQVVQDVVDYGPQGVLDTNATLLTTERIRQLVDAGFEVHFSVDGAISRTYQYVRGFPLSTVAKNIQEFVAYSRTVRNAAESAALAVSGWPKTIVNFTALRRNPTTYPKGELSQRSGLG